MKRSRKLFVGLKAIILMAMVLILSACAVFEDFLNPSDLSASVDRQYGVQINEVSVSKDYVNNGGEDKFVLKCRVESQSSIKSIYVDTSQIGAAESDMINSRSKAEYYSNTINVGVVSAGSKTITIHAENTLEYTKSYEVKLTVTELGNVYVSTNGDNSASGVKAAEAVRTIAKGIKVAQNNAIKQVYVESGTYTNRFYGDYCVKLAEGINLVGGWNNDFTARNPKSSTIDGQSKVIHTILATDVDNAVLDGFVIIGGNATETICPGNDRGGGIYIENGNPTIKDCVISNNQAEMYGGGISTRNFGGLIEGCTIFSNAATKTGGTDIDGSGGGIFLYNSSPTIISNRIIKNNSQGHGGGGIYLYNSSPMMSNNTIISNYAANNGGGMCLDNYSSPTMMYNTISSNYASSDGGGMYLYVSSPAMSHNTISSNRANQNGGGIYLENSSPTMNNNTICSNRASSGGGMFLSSSSPTIMYNTISYNSGYGWAGGGMYLQNSSSPTMMYNTISSNYANSAGGMYLGGSSPTMSHNTISHNSATNGSGGGMWLDSSSPTMMYNTISYNSATNGGGMYLNQSSSTNIQNLILDNWASNSNVIYIINSSSKPVFISNIIGSTNGNTNHYGIYEGDAITGHILRYNFFVSDALGFLYYDKNHSEGTNDIIAVNDTGWTGATVSEGNTVTNYSAAMAMWSSWQ